MNRFLASPFSSSLVHENTALISSPLVLKDLGSVYWQCCLLGGQQSPGCIGLLQLVHLALCLNQSKFMTSVYLKSSLYIDQDLPWEFSQQPVWGSPGAAQCPAVGAVCNQLVCAVVCPTVMCWGFNLYMAGSYISLGKSL